MVDKNIFRPSLKGTFQPSCGLQRQLCHHCEMGAAHSRRCSKVANSAKRKSQSKEKGNILYFWAFWIIFITICPKFSLFALSLFCVVDTGGYLILTLRDDKIIVANADCSVLNIIKTQARKHCLVTMEGWSREMTYYFKIDPACKYAMIQVNLIISLYCLNILLQFVAETLMCLYKVNWTPLTPINVSGAKEKITNKSKNSTHVAICFIKNDEEILLNSPYSSDWCLCIESYR